MHNYAYLHIFYMFSNNHFPCDKHLTCDKRALCDRGSPVSLAFGERSEPIASKILRLSREAGDGTREAGAPGPDLATLHRGVGSGLRGLSINVIVSSNLSSNFLSLREDAVYKIQSLNLNASIKFDLKLPLNAFP